MGRKQTVEDILKEAIQLLESNSVRAHLRACVMLNHELTMIKNFDPDPVNAIAVYYGYLINRYTAVKVLGIWEAVKNWWASRKEKIILRELLNKSQAKSYGDGDGYIQKILNLIRKAI
jgi:hypothetical protein